MNAFVYGFGPFAGVERNPAEDVVRSLSDFDARGTSLQREVLPVSYQAARERLEEVLAASRFDLVLGFGVAPGSEAFRVERVAHNRVDTSALDVDGVLPDSELIVTTGSATLPARIDASRLIAALSEIGIPAVASDDAGRYLCNYVFYLTSVLANPDCSVGFVHVPMASEFLVPGERTSSVPLRAIRQGAAAVLTAALDSAASPQRS